MLILIQIHIYIKSLFHLYSLGGLLDELTEVSDVVWHIDNDYLVTGHLMEHTYHRRQQVSAPERCLL